MNEELISRSERLTRYRLQRIFLGLAPVSWNLASYALFIGVWAVAAYLIGNTILLPDAGRVFASGWRLLLEGSLLPDICASLVRVFAGFSMAAVLAVPLALLMGYFSSVRSLLLPIVTLLRPIPPIAWIPMAILWFGLGNGSSFFITALAAFFPIFLNSFAGAIGVEARYVHAARFLGAGRRAQLLEIFLPAAFPFIWTGLKVGLGQAWMAVVTAELVAAQSGLGYMIQINRVNLETDAVLVGMVSIGVLGTLMNIGLNVIERHIPWTKR